MSAPSENGNRILLGFAGFMGCGKDTGARHLSDKFGYTVLGFADPIREELAYAYDLFDTDIMIDDRKETPTQLFAYGMCLDRGFREHMKAIGRYDPMAHLSPREAQQFWGDYKRAADVNYFIDKMKQRIENTAGDIAVSGVRVSYTHPNPYAERDLIYALGGRIVHIVSDADRPSAHGTEQRLPVLQKDFVLRNTKLSPDGLKLYLKDVEGLHREVVELNL